MVSQASYLYRPLGNLYGFRPSVPLNLQNTILALLLSLLDGASDYHHARSKESKARKRKLASTGPDGENQRRRKHLDISKNDDTDKAERPMEVDNVGTPEPDTTGADEQSLLQPQPSATEDTSTMDCPAVLKHITLGINEVTKRLEKQIKEARSRVVMGDATTVKDSDANLQPTLKLIFACRADVNPAMLIDHLPHLIAAYNSGPSPEILKIIPLPKNAEMSLAHAIGVRRVAVIGLDVRSRLLIYYYELTLFQVGFPDLPSLLSLVEAVPPLAAPWLSTERQSKDLIPTHIKQVRTFAPKDMKATKERRAEGKEMAKRRRLAARISKAQPTPK